MNLCLIKHIVFGLSVSSISEGYIFGQLSGMISTMLSKDSDVSLTPEEVSWMASILFITGVMGSMLSALLAERCGRKMAISLLNMPLMIYWITLYYAHEFIVFLLARAMAGFFFGGVMSVIFLSAAEYTNPHERASYLMLITSLGPSLGGFIGNLLFTKFHWRVVALFGIIPTTLAALHPFFWIESPSWLASKGRFEECERNFRKLHGHGTSVDNELKLLIAVEKKKQIININGISEIEPVIKRLLRAARQKYFWKVGLLISILLATKAAVGKVSLGIYINTILIETVGRVNALLLSIIEGSLIAGCCLSSFCMRQMTVRGLLFFSGYACVATMMTLSICIAFTLKEDILWQWVKVALLAIYFFIIHMGIFPICESLPTEVFPLDIKDVCTFLFSIVGAVIMFTSIKVLPSMMNLIGFQGIFALNAGIILLTLLYLWRFLPETKGRTLQEIELYFKNGQFCNISNMLLSEEQKLSSTQPLH
ncbi:uncharacterized protein LOC106132334 isoform X2 [Amyelois transitella]|uniref:uncharacterized protein LOC106132334 isoform X2 n=1 Tax=Amyelois transitella TaxID=680683 RepID=UPI00067B27B3|nr:uncharacterized protein LOC106132334 isoform X2 [Amyelois transitella]